MGSVIGTKIYTFNIKMEFIYIYCSFTMSLIIIQKLNNSFLVSYIPSLKGEDPVAERVCSKDFPICIFLIFASFKRLLRRSNSFGDLK